MSKHPSTRQLIGYHRRELGPDDFLWVRRHLLSCPACAGTYGDVPPLGADYTTLQGALIPGTAEGPFHLTGEEALDYVRGCADEVDTEIFETHLEDCPDCTGLVTAVRRSYGVPAEGVSLPGVDSLQRPRPPLARLFESIVRSPLKAAASLAAVVAVVTLTAALVLRWGGEREGAGRTAVLDVPGRSDSAATGTQTPLPAEQQQREQTENGHDPDDTRGLAPPRVPPSTAVAAPASAPLVTLKDAGGVVTLRRDGTVTGLAALPRELRGSVSAALLHGRVETPRELAELREGRGVLLGGGGDGSPFGPLSPVGVVIADRRPLFRWSTLQGASSYSVTVADAGYDEVITSGPLAGTEWRVPVELAPGKTYYWQVTARRGEEEVRSPTLPAPAAKFKLLDGARAEELRRARRRYAGSHLVLGLLYARAGLLGEAEREFRALSEQNPESAVPAKLLRGVRLIGRERHRR